VLPDTKFLFFAEWKPKWATYRAPARLAPTSPGGETYYEAAADHHLLFDLADVTTITAPV